MLRCSVVWAIFKRNLASYFAGSLGFLFITAFVFFDAFLTFTPGFFSANVATLEHLTANMPLLLLFFVPAITMAVWAEERKQGTDELLFTLPATDVEILLGKFGAVLGVYTISLFFTLTKVAVLAGIRIGGVVLFEGLANPDGWQIATTYLGYWLAGAAMLGAGMFASAIIPNTTAAFVLGVVVCAVPVFVDLLPFAPELAGTLSIGHHLEEFGKGLVPLSGIVYFLSLIGFTLYLNYVMITRRHWSANKRAYMGLHHAARAVALFVVLVAVNYAVRRESTVTTLRVDATAENVHTLTGETRAVVSEIPEAAPVTIEAFVSPNLPPEHVAQARSLENLLRQYERLGGNLLSVGLLETSPHTSEAEAAKKWDIEPRSVSSQDEAGQLQSEVFLGAVVHSPRGQVVIPFFDEGLSVEHELTRAISAVTEREKLKIGVVATDADIMGGQRSGETTFARFLGEFYDVQPVFPGSKIDVDRSVEYVLLDAKKKEFRDEHAKLVEERKAREEARKAESEKPEPMPEPDPFEGSEGDDAKPDEDDPAPDGKSADEEADDPDTSDEPGDDSPDDPSPEDESTFAEEPLPSVDDYVAKEMKKYRKETNRGEFLEEDPAKSLDDAKLPDDLLKRLRWRNVRLSTEATVEIVTKGSKWTVSDVNPEKEYTIEKKDGKLVVTMPRYDVLVAVLPSLLPEAELKNVVDYVKTGRPVLIFDDPLPFHIDSITVGLSPVQPKPQPPGPPQSVDGEKKAFAGKATSLLEALGISWQYDEIVWDEYDPHPNFREFPTRLPGFVPQHLYVSSGNGTPTAIAGSTAPGVGELLFIYPGRINPVEKSKFDFTPLVRVGTDSGTYVWDDLVVTRPPNSWRGRPEAIVERPKKEPKFREDGKRKAQFVLAAHITTKSGEADESDGGEKKSKGEKPKEGESKDEKAKKPKDERNVIFVADVDAIGIIPLEFFVNQDARDYFDVDFSIDNRTFVLNAIDVLGGRGDVVALRDRRPRLPRLRAIERSKRELEASKAEQIRETREAEEKQIEEFQESVDAKGRELAETEGLTRLEQLQRSSMNYIVERANLDERLRRIRDDAEAKIDGYEAEFRRQVAGLHEKARIWSIAIPMIPPLLLWIVWAVARSISEGSHVDPRRARH